VPFEFDVLSVDVDLYDYWILERILSSGRFRPRVIIVETNPTLGLYRGKFKRRDFAKINMHPLVVNHPDMTNQTVWDMTRYAGGNPMAFQILGSKYGYDLVYCEKCGVNCFLVEREGRGSVNGVGHLSGRLPAVHYPCFGTALTNGAYPGHVIDSTKRKVS